MVRVKQAKWCSQEHVQHWPDKRRMLSEFEYVAHHTSSKVVVELNNRLNKSGVINPLGRGGIMASTAASVAWAVGSSTISWVWTSPRGCLNLHCTGECRRSQWVVVPGTEVTLPDQSYVWVLRLLCLLICQNYIWILGVSIRFIYLGYEQSKYWFWFLFLHCVLITQIHFSKIRELYSFHCY